MPTRTRLRICIGAHRHATRRANAKRSTNEAHLCPYHHLWTEALVSTAKPAPQTPQKRRQEGGISSVRITLSRVALCTAETRAQAPPTTSSSNGFRRLRPERGTSSEGSAPSEPPAASVPVPESSTPHFDWEPWADAQEYGREDRVQKADHETSSTRALAGKLCTTEISQLTWHRSVFEYLPNVDNKSRGSLKEAQSFAVRAMRPQTFAQPLLAACDFLRTKRGSARQCCAFPERSGRVNSQPQRRSSVEREDRV